MIAIRQATKKDFAAIWPLLRDVFRAGDTYAVARDITADQAQVYWLDTAVATYVAEMNGLVVGTYYIKTNQAGGGAHVCNCGYIVAATAQGQGIAGKLCVHSQEQARLLGFTAMQFNFVLETNKGAVGLWHKHGFTTLGTIPDAFDHPSLGLVGAHIMHKPLT